jgi:hypothetical protein
MDVQNGFIVRVYNHCDGWCERCALTSHCRVFVDRVRMEAARDAHFTSITEAPPLPEADEGPPPAWLAELIDEANEAARTPMSDECWQRMRPRVPAEHRPIVRRANDYAKRTSRWLTTSEHGDPLSSEPDAVISWFQFLITVKIRRALTVCPDDDDDDITAFDKDGSAKVALIGISRSHAAWLELVERGSVAAPDADPFIADLVWLGEALKRVRPRARGFIRAGLDEPEAVEALRAALEGRS